MHLSDLHIDKTTYRAVPGDFYTETYRKKRIILHYTAGSSVSGAAAELLKRNGICVAYIIDKNGEIYEFFNPIYWAYSLGVQDPNYTKGHFEWESIAIEHVNEGPLTYDGTNYYWWPNNWSTPYYGPTINYSFRGFNYFPTFPQEQLQSSFALVNAICTDFNIPKQIPPPEKVLEYDLAFYDTFEGISSHQNYRASGKWDIGPAYDWIGLNNSLSSNS